MTKRLQRAYSAGAIVPNLQAARFSTQEGGSVGYLSFITDLFWACLGPVLGLFWDCLGPVLGLFGGFKSPFEAPSKLTSVQTE